jgi:LAS superfamily LD-carboxypeptidase LdcB
VSKHLHPNNVVKLTPAAMRGFREAERIRGKHILVTGSLRTCAFQQQQYDSAPGRFAAPGSSAHPRGLAIDTLNADQATKDALRAAGWTQSRAGDEPWHWSFGVTA